MKKATIALLLFCVAAFAQQKDTFTDSRDGKTYKTVKIGEQVWMAENLNNDASGSKCYDNKPANCEKYGRLYNWATAMKACPNGWHLPSQTEWKGLMDFIASNKKDVRYVKEYNEYDEEIEYYSNAGKYLKAKSGWYKGGNGTDDYGFSALPSGSGSSGPDSYFNVGERSIWWSSTGSGSISAWHWIVDYRQKGVTPSRIDASMLYSVRCVEGETEHSNFDGIGDIPGGVRGSAGGVGTRARGSLKAPSARDIDMGSDGSRSKQEIMQILNARMPGLKNIYNGYLKLKPGFSGEVTLKFTIAPSGNITNIEIVSSTTGYAEFDEAVKNTVATWKWKTIKSGNTTPTIPFSFTE